MYELYHLLLLSKYGNYTSSLEIGDDKLINERWTFSEEIAKVLMFLGLKVNEEQYYHTVFDRVTKIITVPLADSKQPHHIYAPVVQILLKPACIEALSRYCKTILEPLAVYVPLLYEYLSNPGQYRKTKQDPTRKETVHKLRALFCTDFFS